MVEVAEDRGIKVALTGVALGVVAGLGLGWWALAAGGAGHGNLLPGLLAFPFAFLCGRGGETAAVLIGLVQYPVYGWILGNGMRRGRLWQTLPWLLAVHAAAIIVLFVIDSGLG